jgi:glycosyltransferase involved in cell wall biosynthesis
MKVLLFANTDWYLYNFRLPLARALRAKGAEVVLVSPQGSYGSRLEVAGFRWLPIYMQRRSLNPLRELGLLLQLARLYRRESPDIVHHFTIKCVIYGSLAARAAGILRCINAVTGMGYVYASNGLHARLLRPFISGLLRIALRGNLHRLIVQNADDCTAFMQTGLTTPNQIRLIRGSGVNTTLFQPAKTDRRSVDTLHVLFAARFLWDKGIGEFVEAARKLKGLGLPIEFILAGESDPGNPAAVPPDVVQSWRDEGLINVLGYVEDMASCLNEVDLAVLPSYYREGLPKSLIEAAACGLPIITTDTPGCRDAVVHGETGLLVPCRNVEALVEAIRFMFENPDLRARMGAAGRERVLREFDEQIVLVETLAVYQELIAEIPT